MEPWTLARYRRPYLAVDQVELIPLGTKVAIRAGAATRTIDCENASVAEQIATGLERLQEPSDPLWLRALEPGSGEPWPDIVRYLDEWSLIRDRGAEAAGEWLESERRILDAAVAETTGAILARVGEDDRPGLRRNASALLEEIRAHEPIDEPWDAENFYVGVLSLMVRRLRRAAPLALWAAAAVLEGVCQARPDGPTAGGVRFPDEAAGGAYSPHELRVRLTALADLLVRSVAADAQRLSVPAQPREGPVSGSEFVRDAEQALRDVSERLGQGRFIEALGRAAPDAPLVVGCYVEEYHVTRRFVEMITPLMSKDLEPRLRKLAYRYFAEEVGHEAFEQETCASLGVAADTLDAAIPLPLHVAFVDVFTHLAETDPAGFFAAVSITEGMLGEPSPVSDILHEAGSNKRRFRDVFRRHDDLNRTLHHAAIARLALQEIAALTPLAQRRALASLAFLQELNFRAWEALEAFYGAPGGLAHHGWLAHRLGAEDLCAASAPL